jgi:hypothetical protein
MRQSRPELGRRPVRWRRDRSLDVAYVMRNAPPDGGGGLGSAGGLEVPVELSVGAGLGSTVLDTRSASRRDGPQPFAPSNGLTYR